MGKRQWRGAPREIGAGLNNAFFFSSFLFLFFRRLMKAKPLRRLCLHNALTEGSGLFFSGYFVPRFGGRPVEEQLLCRAFFVMGRFAVFIYHGGRSTIIYIHNASGSVGFFIHIWVRVGHAPLVLKPTRILFIPTLICFFFFFFSQSDA